MQNNECPTRISWKAIVWNNQFAFLYLKKVKLPPCEQKLKEFF